MQMHTYYSIHSKIGHQICCNRSQAEMIFEIMNTSPTIQANIVFRPL